MRQDVCLRRRIEQRKTGELAVDREVTGPGALPHEEGQAGEVPIQQPDEALEARFDRRPSRLVGAHVGLAGNLPLAHELRHCLMLRVRRGHGTVQRQDVAGLLDIRLVVPSVVEHGLRQPLVTEVLEQ